MHQIHINQNSQGSECTQHNHCVNVVTDLSIPTDSQKNVFITNNKRVGGDF